VEGEGVSAQGCSAAAEQRSVSRALQALAVAHTAIARSRGVPVRQSTASAVGDALVPSALPGFLAAMRMLRSQAAALRMLGISEEATAADKENATRRVVAY
jgi:hypothetical protein